MRYIRTKRGLVAVRGWSGAEASTAYTAYTTAANQPTAAPVETWCDPGFYWSAGAGKCLNVATSTSNQTNQIQELARQASAAQHAADVARQACPSGQVWNSSANGCVWASTTADQPVASCVIMGNCATQPSAAQADTPKTILKDCPAGQVWNDSIQGCVWTSATATQPVADCVLTGTCHQADTATRLSAAAEEDATATLVAESQDPASIETGTQNLQVDATTAIPTSKIPPNLVNAGTPAPAAATSSSIWVYALIGLAVVGGGAYYLSTRKSK